MATETVARAVSPDDEGRWTPINYSDPSSLPPVGVTVLARVRWFDNPESTLDVALVRVDEDDCSWRTADDGSEISYSVDVCSWRHIAPTGRP